MEPYLLLLCAAALVSAGCAGCVLARDPTKRPNQLAGLLILGAAFWAMCEVNWNQAPDAESAILRMRASALGWGFVGPLVLHLFLATTRERWPRLERLLPVLYATSACTVALGWFTPWLMQDAVRTSWGWGYRVGPLFGPYYVATMVGVIAGVAVITQTFREVYSPAERRQQPWILLGVGVPLSLASMTDAVLPLLDVQVPRFGTASFAVLGAIAVYCEYRFGYSFLTPPTFAREILASLPDGVALLDYDGHLRSVNDGFARLSGHDPAELPGRHLSELVALPLEELPEELDEVESELVRAGGERIPVSVSTSVLTDRQGYPIGLVLVLRDQREVADLRSHLATSARLAAVGQLAAGIAHEINNPIAFVRANLSLLQGHWKTVRADLAGPIRERGLVEVIGEGDELIEESIEGVDRAAEIVRGVKGFSHSGSGVRERADVNQILEDVLHVASPQLRSAMRVERHYDDVPRLLCAPQELKQVFLNLIVNAGQAVGDGGVVRLRTACRGANVLVDVEDDGHGIPPEIADRIFDPFFTTKCVGEGTGLGLGIAYQIVESHGGDITVESQPGEGTRFRVRLPLTE